VHSSNSSSLHFNRDSGAGAGTDSDDYEFDAITSANLGSANYLLISLNFTEGLNALNNPGTAALTLQIQTKEVGGAYADSMAVKTIRSVAYLASTTGMAREFKWVHTLTAGEKANGVQVKVLAAATTTGTGSNASLTNFQSTISTLR
jgi:pectate lyase